MTLRILSLFLLLNAIAIAQPPQGGGQWRGGLITGLVLDATGGAPVEYAEIVLHNAADSAVVTGTTSDENGRFTLEGVRPGRYYLEYFFIGFVPQTSDPITLERGAMRADLGTIRLSTTAIAAEAVTVEGERAPISYQIDKKVIDVDQQLTATTGTAVDVLENVPSVTVDIEGNVTLRGSSNFRVLVDGRPSVMDAADVLQQIPSSSIDDIEIITNPSARYSPEGTAGIINIVLKKKQHSGRSGIASVNLGDEDRYGADVLVENKSERYTTTFSADYNRRFMTGDRIMERRTTVNDRTSFTNSDGSSPRGRVSLGLRAGLDINLTPSDLLGFGARFGDHSHEMDSRMGYTEWSSSDPARRAYTSIQDRERTGTYLALNSSYRHRFPTKGHELTADVFYSRRDGDEETLNQLVDAAGDVTSGQVATESGPGSELRAKMDYVQPVGERHRWEAGFQSELDRSDDETGLEIYDTALGQFVDQPDFSYATRYNRDIHAAYLIYGGEWKRLGFQGGLRGEYTDRLIEIIASEDRFTIDRRDLFPSLHLSYQQPGGQQMMASYTRRIERPRGWYLEPFETRMDAFNVRVGNPALQPEYIDSYEAGYQTYFGKNLFSTEMYFRRTTNKIDRVQSVYAENVTLHTYANTGRDYALGTELLLNLDVQRRWNLNLMGNFYQYRVEGEVFGETFDRESVNWSARMNNNIKLSKSWQLQADGFYNSPSVSSQGRREGFFMANAAVKYSFLNNQVAATLQVRDIFATGRWEFTSEGRDFYTYMRANREAPLFMFNLRYNFNNYKPDRRERGGGGEGGGEEDF